MTNELDYAYAAGIIDGEGCIEIYPVGRRKNRKYIPNELSLSVGMANKEVPLWLKEIFSGCTYNYRDKRYTDKGMYRWSLKSRKAVTVLRLLLPYLRVKKEQAQMAIEYQSGIVPGQHRTQEEDGRQKRFMLLMKQAKENYYDE